MWVPGEVRVLRFFIGFVGALRRQGQAACQFVDKSAGCEPLLSILRKKWVNHKRKEEGRLARTQRQDQLLPLLPDIVCLLR